MRCSWCAVRLRWWQKTALSLGYCWRCKLALFDRHGCSAPCMRGARADAEPDRWRHR